MGLFKKVSEARMKDGVDGTLQVVGVTSPDPNATDANYRMDAVVSAPGLDPTAIVHHGYCSVAKWPYPGQTLPVKVDRANPKHVVIDFGQVPKSKDTAKAAAEQLADQMRQSGGTTTTVGGVTIDGANVTTGSDGAFHLDLAGGRSVTINLGQVADAASEAQAAAVTTPTVVTAADILARGTAGSATLLGSFASDQPAVKAGHTNIGLMLNVMIDGHAPFQVQNLYAVPDDKVTKLTPGVLLPVKADLSSTGMVAVDWSAV